MKKFLGCYHQHIYVLIVIFSLVSLSVNLTTAQTHKKKNQVTETAKHKNDNPGIIRWRIFLDSLAQEARTVSAEERRPYAVVDVANAYWEIDRDESKALYVSALDAAWSLKEQSKKHGDVLKYVLSSASKLDSNLAKTLMKRILDKEDSVQDKDDISSSIALDLLKEDPPKAAQLAEAFAPNGLQNGTATFFIFRLAEQDIQLSNRVYGVYLNKVSANENIPLEWILPLGGYAFGYAEFYSIDKKGETSGVTFPKIESLYRNPVFTNYFLNIAYQRIARTIERRNNATGVNIEGFNYPILFALEYLMPEVAKFSPNSLTAWHLLQQQGIAGTTPQQSQRVASLIESIHQSRARAQRYNNSPETAEKEAEASLENVEKLVGTCQRDVVYSKAALTFGSHKNFKRAVQIVGEIEDLKQNEIVKQVIFFDMALSAVENGDLEEAHEKLKRISSPERKIIIYAKLAEALLNKDEKADSKKAFSAAVELTEKLSETEVRTGFLLGMSGIPLKTDRTEALTMLETAVKNLNKLEVENLKRFSIPIRVPLDCNGEGKTWYGGSVSLSNSNIFEAVTLFAKENPDEIKTLADFIADKVTRIRAQATVTKIALINVKKLSGK